MDVDAQIKLGGNAVAILALTKYCVVAEIDTYLPVASISSETIQDEARPDVYYYRVFIRTESDALVNNAGKRVPIVPGMVGTVDIRTDNKTVFDYLVEPLNRVHEALRER